MIEELISRVFWTRNLSHIAHWATKSYAQHMALGDFYDSIIETLDKIVEAYQGKVGLVKPYLDTPKAPTELISHLQDDTDWIAANRSSIAAKCSAIENLVDELLDTYLTTLYKLKNLS